MKTLRLCATPSASEAPCSSGAVLWLWFFTWCRLGVGVSLRRPLLQRRPAAAVVRHGCSYVLGASVVVPCGAHCSRGVLPEWCCATAVALRMVQASPFCATSSAPEAPCSGGAALWLWRRAWRNVAFLYEPLCSRGALLQRRCGTLGEDIAFPCDALCSRGVPLQRRCPMTGVSLGRNIVFPCGALCSRHVSP